MKTAVSLDESTAQPRYKRNLDRNAQLETIIKVKNYIFVDITQLATIASDTAGRLVNLQYNIISWPGLGTYNMLSDQYHIVIVEENDIRSTVLLTFLHCHPHEHWCLIAQTKRRRPIAHSTRTDSNKSLLRAPMVRGITMPLYRGSTWRVDNVWCGNTSRKKVYGKVVGIWTTRRHSQTGMEYHLAFYK